MDQKWWTWFRNDGNVPTVSDVVMVPGLLPISCKIKSGSGLGTRLGLLFSRTVKIALEKTPLSLLSFLVFGVSSQRPPLADSSKVQK